MKNILFIYCLLYSFSIFSQSKTIVPISGTIVFIKEEKILDKDLYLKSYKELMPKMKKAMGEQIVMERLMNGKKTDTIQLKSEVDRVAQNMLMMLPFILEDKQVIKFHHEFKGDTIINYNEIDGAYNNEKIINQVTGAVTNEFNEYAELESNEIIKLTEFKNEIKLINGYKCFKIIYTYNEPEIELDFLANVTSNIRELWVTEEIKCNYHPVVNESEILQKYYPLEIIEYSDDIKGFITTYKIETFNLN